MSRSRRPLTLPNDIDSCSALAGELLASAAALGDGHARAEASFNGGETVAGLARDAALLGRALAEYTECVRRLRRENSHTPAAQGLAASGGSLSGTDPRAHRAATEIGKARARLRGVALMVGAGGDG